MAIIGLVACLHSEGLSRELADSSSPTADPETQEEGTASGSTGSLAGLDRTSSGGGGSPVDAAVSSASRGDEPTRVDAEGSRLSAVEASSATPKENADGDIALLPDRPGSQVRSEARENTDPKPGAGDSSGDDGPRAEASATPSAAAESEIPGPATSMATLLGARQKRLEARLQRDGSDGDGGWVHYGTGLAVRYESGRAVEAALRVPAGLTCVEAARWAGFRRAMPPLYRVGGCSWPGISARHRIHRGVVGELAQSTGILQFWSAKASG